MLRTLRIPPSADIAFVCGALTRVPAREVALEWPLGACCALAGASEMQTLLDTCAALGKAVIILGGDETLRAHAVAAGFGAATSLGEWETAKQRAVRPRPQTYGPDRPRVATGYPGAPAVRILAPADTREDPHLYDLTGDDPPGYVVELVATGQLDPPAERLAVIPTIPLHLRRKPSHRDERRREAAAAIALERAQQVYEERITATIRTSGQSAEANPDTTAASVSVPVSEPHDESSSTNV
jgi:hypothetical protein